MNSPAPYRYSFGPWNIHEGADPFGPPVRPIVDFSKKLDSYKELGFDAVQFHDDDVVIQLEEKSWSDVQREAAAVRETLQDAGLLAEFVAPRLWEDHRGIDGGYTSNDPSIRRWAIERSKKAIDIAHLIGTDLIVLWLAREGTYVRESKCAALSYEYIIEAINVMLEYNPWVRIAIEPKPNEPMDQAFVPTIGHALAVAQRTCAPHRVGGLIETAHAKLVGLDPSDEMAFALGANKLWSVHLNDQNGLKYDQDKSFGSVDLRGAFNQVQVLERAGYSDTGAFVGFDVKAVRTQRAEMATGHLANSKATFELLVEKARSFPEELSQEFVANRDYEALDQLVITHLMGASAPATQRSNHRAVEVA